MRNILPFLLAAFFTLLTDAAEAQCLTTFASPAGQSAIPNGSWGTAAVPPSTSVSLNLNTTAGSNVAQITGCNAALVANQAAVSGPNVAAGTFITSGTCPTVVLNQNATATGNTLHTFNLPAYAQNYPPTNTGVPNGLNCSVCPATFSAPVCAGEYFTYYMCAGNAYTISLCGSVSLWNSTITITTTAGVVLGSGSGNYSDDDCGVPGGHAELTFVPSVSATYRVRVFEAPCSVNPSSCGTVLVTCGNVPDPPMNDEAASALSISAGTGCAPIEATTDYATASSGVAVPSNCEAGCAVGSGGYAGQDVWFSVDVPTGGELVVQTELLSASDIALAAYTGVPGSLVQLNAPTYCGSCNADLSASDPAPFLWLTGLTPGSTIFLRAWPEGGFAASGTFTICAQQPNPPASDTPCGAETLMVSAACEPTPISTLFATSAAAGMTITPALPSCGSQPQADIWMTVTIPATGGMLLSTIAGTVSDAALAVYALTSGTACAGSLTELACASGGTGMPVLEFGGVPGATYFVRLWSENAAQGGFSICAQALAPPANDDPENARPLALDGDCFSPNSAWLATASSVDDPLNCEVGCGPGTGGYAGGDVWFRLDVPQDGDILFQATGLNGAIGMALYEGTVDALSQLNAPGHCGSCVHETGTITIPLSNQAAGATLWVRIWPDGGPADLDFLLCAIATDYYPPSDCDHSLTICGDDTIQVAPTDFGNVQDLFPQNDGCLSFEHQGIWMNVTTYADGELAFSIIPPPNTDYDFAVWGPFASTIPCPPSDEPIRCSWSALTGPGGLDYVSDDTSEGAGGDGWVRRITASSHETYLIYVDNWSTNGLGFDLVWNNQPSDLIDCISTSVLDPSGLESVTVTPNPARDALTAEWPITGSGRIDVLDAQGRLVLQSGHDGGSRFTLDVSALPVGLYTMRLIGRNGAASGTRFVKD